jgi:hypothetical protein
MPVDDQNAHASPNELVGEHQPGRAGPDDQNVSIHLSPIQPRSSISTSGPT